MREHIFSGIYPDFAVADLQSYGEGFDSEEAVARAVQKLQEARTSPKSNIPIGLRTCSLPAFIAAQKYVVRGLYLFLTLAVVSDLVIGLFFNPPQT